MFKKQIRFLIIMLCFQCFGVFGQQKHASKTVDKQKIKKASKAVFKTHWIEDRFYKNMNLVNYPWYYDIVPELVFEPLQLHITLDSDPEKNSSFYFSGGEQTYSINMKLQQKEYLNTINAKDKRATFEVAPNGSLMPPGSTGPQNYYGGRGFGR